MIVKQVNITGKNVKSSETTLPIISHFKIYTKQIPQFSISMSRKYKKKRGKPKITSVMKKYIVLPKPTDLN